MEFGRSMRDVPVHFADTPHTDAFSRLRTAENVGLFDSTFQYTTGAIRYNSITAAGGTITHLPNEASASLATAASPGSSAALQSKAYHRYIPGKSQLALMTFVLGAATAGIVKRVGYFEANDGIFLEQNGTTDVAVVCRTSTSGAPVDNRVVQANWNIDKMDGTGKSGVTLDLTKTQILVIDFQWLGVGRARIGFDIDGIIYPVHEFRNANALTLVYMKTANLPVRWEIAGNGVASMKAICAAVVSEGGVEDDLGFEFSASTTLGTPRTFTAGTPLPIIAVRPKATFNGVTNRVQLRHELFSYLVMGGAAEWKWRLVYDCTITGGAWVSADANSVAEYNITGTALVGGITIDQGFDNAAASSRVVQEQRAAEQRYPWCQDGAGNQIVLALVGDENSGSTDIYAVMRWRELR